METQNLGSPKIKGIEDSSSEQEDEKQRINQTRKEFTLVAQKAVQFHENCVKNSKYVATEICSLINNQECFPCGFVVIATLILKAIQIHDDEDSRLALKMRHS